MDLISRIVGRNLGAVEQLLGEAQEKEVVYVTSRATAQVHRSVKAYFLNKTLEVHFIEGVADWITIYAANTHSSILMTEFIESFHLKNVEKAISKSPVGIKYYNKDGLHQVHFYKNASNQIDSIHIKALTS